MQNKTSFEALPPQYQALLMDNRSLVLDTEQAAYDAEDAKNLQLFKETLTEVSYTDAQRAEFQDKAAKPVWDAWVADNQEKFDAQGLLDDLLSYAEEARAR